MELAFPREERAAQVVGAWLMAVPWIGPRPVTDCL
jgi:hypothetical protein